MKQTSILFIAMSLTGCASVNEAEQSIKIETRTENGELVSGAACQADNDHQHATTTSGGRVLMHRSAENLIITCTKPGYAPAKATVESSTNSGFWGNLLVGGYAGMMTDHATGKGYSYPEEVTLIFGKNLEID